VRNHFCAAIAALVVSSGSATPLIAAEPLSASESAVIAPLKGADRAYVEHALQNSKDDVLKIEESADWQTGDAGHLETERVKMRVMSKDELLVTQRRASRRELSVNAAVREEHLLGPTIWMSGVSTRLYTDHTRDMALPPETIFVCTGIRDYKTPAGAARRVKRLQAVDLALAEPILEQILNARGLRTWTLQGRKVRGASRSKAVGGMVEIRTIEGKILRARLHQLSQADQTWLAGGAR
jgi:hypothetical protein